MEELKFSEEIVGSIKGQDVVQYTLANDNGMEVSVLNIGATLTRIITPDKDGKLENVILHWMDVANYEQNPGFFGAVVGRVAGRISKAKVTLNGKAYHFTVNENSNILHGGNGFHSKFWTVEDQTTPHSAKVKLSYFSKDGEEGFPGNLNAYVTYSLNNDNELTVEYDADTDQTTLVNLTNHAYFNLSGDGKRSILEQEVYIDSDSIFELDEESIPTGKMLSVDDETAFDFRVPKTIGQNINDDSIFLKYGKGYDHLWKLNQGNKAIRLYDAISGRTMEVTTTEPCVVMYAMNNPSSYELNISKQDIRYGVCFETQRSAIGYNEVFKETCILEPDKTYHAATTFKFGIK